MPMVCFASIFVSGSTLTNIERGTLHDKKSDDFGRRR
jgi:hypothetical protein